MPYDPWPCPQGDEASRSFADRRNGAPAAMRRIREKYLISQCLYKRGARNEREPNMASLLGKAGFRLTQVVPTNSAANIVEAVPA